MALRLIAAGAVAGTMVVGALIVHADRPYAWIEALYPLMGLVYTLTGVAAWARRPGSSLGLLLVAAGGFTLAGTLGSVAVPAIAAVGAVTATVTLAVIVHLLLSFPTGRLHGRRPRIVVTAGYAVCLVLQAPMYLFAPDGLLSVADRPQLVTAGADVQRIAGALVVLATAALLIERMRQADATQRRVLVPLSVYGIAALLVVPVSSLLEPHLFGDDPVPRSLIQLLVLGLVPIVFAVAATRGGFDRTSDLTELGDWLGTDESGRPALRTALATALGDPSVQVLFRVPGHDALVDDRGLPVPGPDGRDAGRRGTVDVELGGRVVGAIVYDAMLVDRPEEVRRAGRVVALALDRERLTVELRASRARIAATADGERRRIARDLHDGLQARLVLLAVQAAGTTDQATLRSGIQSAIGELRELVHGVMPATLTEQGLAAAVEDFGDRLPLPLDLRVGGLDARLRPDVESAAYFVVSEAVTNALKHGAPTALRVALNRSDGRLTVEIADDGTGGARVGGGIRGSIDRVEALGGELRIDSPPGGGTHVRAVIPCGS